MNFEHVLDEPKSQEKCCKWKFCRDRNAIILGVLEEVCLQFHDKKYNINFLFEIKELLELNC